jgi:hypothetical protein
MAAVGLEPASRNAEKTRETPEPAAPGGAESGALSDANPSPALSILVKLAAGLTGSERAALVRALQRGEGG